MLATLPNAKKIPAGQAVKGLLLSVGGLLLAMLGNALIPQYAALTITLYQLGPLVMDLNGFYRIVLGVLALFWFVQGLWALRTDKRWAAYAKKGPFRFAVGLALLALDAAGTKLQITPQPFFPGPAQVLESFLMEGPFITKNLLYSLRLFSTGFFFGVVLGVLTGILIGWFPKVYYWLYPLLKISGVIPAVAWMPFALTLFPTSFAAAVFLLVITVWFPVASQTAFGIQGTPKMLFEAASTLGAKTPYLVFHVAIPYAMPSIFTGITTACAGSFTCLVMAEMMGQPGGLGYYINISKVWSAYYKIFAAILLMAVLFSLILAVLGAVRAHVLRWQRGQFK